MLVSCSTRVTWLSPSLGRDDAQLFAQSRTLRIRQLNSLNFSTVWPTSPLLTCYCAQRQIHFHEVSRAARPNGQLRHCWPFAANLLCPIPERL